MTSKQAKKFCPNADPTCDGGTTCGLCGGHVCSHWTAAYDIKTGTTYHVACGDSLRRKRN